MFDTLVLGLRLARAVAGPPGVDGQTDTLAEPRGPVRLAPQTPLPASLSAQGRTPPGPETDARLKDNRRRPVL